MEEQKISGIKKKEKIRKSTERKKRNSDHCQKKKKRKRERERERERESRNGRNMKEKP